MRFAVGLLVTWLVVGAQSARAGDCVPAGPPAKLNSETVDWTIDIVSGQTCLRGLRTSAMILESVAISAPARLARRWFREMASRMRRPAISRARIHFQ